MKKRLFISNFSIRARRIISVFAVVLLTVLAVYKSADLLEVKTSRIKYHDFFNSKTNFDVIFMGTSHMYNSVFPMEIWRDYGISSYNWGYSNCTPTADYYLIQDIIKYTSPKVVVVDVFGIAEYGHWTKFRSDAIGQYHVQFDSLPLSREKIKAAREAFDSYPGNDDFIWNFLTYHNRWNSLRQEDFNYEYSAEKGACITSGTLGRVSYNAISSDLKSDELYGFNFDNYLALIEYCNDHNIQVLSVYLPFNAQEFNQRIANTMGDIIEKYPNCRYFNMLNEGVLDFDTDVTEDNEHLNYSGGSKVTRRLGQYLADNYDLDDYSTNENWINDYKKYYDYKIRLMNEESSLPLYLVHLADDDFIADALIYDETLLESEWIGKLFDNAGITPVLTRKNEQDDEGCAKLVIRSSKTGDLIEEVMFEWTDPETHDIMSVHKK